MKYIHDRLTQVTGNDLKIARVVIRTNVGYSVPQSPYFCLFLPPATPNLSYLGMYDGVSLCDRRVAEILTANATAAEAATGDAPP